ncbi:hypothetical protein ILUMI_05245 [Ignelater luminosus]|uniref:Uncharacterized protein n=1 Tax=Ignelater luminosus TaxID=2038154 RepID=A0A8K0GGJ8_IGNLU|nr:hypothetical protein ILUMI_05245 [Ignelater luminosus]
MKFFIVGVIVSCLILNSYGEETRLIELEPDEAAQIINKQDQSLRYAPKIESNVPGVRIIGDHPEQVVQDIYLANQYHGQDGLGAYVYGYSVPDIAKTEKKERSGDLKGAYNYIAEDGQEIKVEYWDDGTGFHQIDNIPKIQPKQVEDSPEVKAAKEEHLRIWHEQAERNSHAPADPYSNQYNQPQQPVQNQYQQYQGQAQYQPQPQPYSSQTSGVTHYQASQGQAQAQVHAQAQVQPQPIGQPLPSQYAASSSAHIQGQQTSGAFPQLHGQVQAQHGGVSGGAQVSPNSVEYSGQYSANQPTRVQGPGAQYASGQYAQGSSGGQQAWAQGSGKQGHQEEEEEVTGPPKGFFYSFDYAVPIIVGREGKNLEAYYSQNKNLYEQQLKGEAPRPASASSSYQAHA